jgi:hypothetical protein
VLDAGWTQKKGEPYPRSRFPFFLLLHTHAGLRACVLCLLTTSPAITRCLGARFPRLARVQRRSGGSDRERGGQGHHRRPACPHQLQMGDCRRAHGGDVLQGEFPPLPSLRARPCVCAYREQIVAQTNWNGIGVCVC